MLQMKKESRNSNRSISFIKGNQGQLHYTYSFETFTQSSIKTQAKTEKGERKKKEKKNPMLSEHGVITYFTENVEGGKTIL